MALHLIPAEGPHAPTSECGCSPIRTLGVRPDGTHGALYLHQPADYHDLDLGLEDDDQEGRTDAAASD